MSVVSSLLVGSEGRWCELEVSEDGVLGRSEVEGVFVGSEGRWCVLIVS